MTGYYKLLGGVWLLFEGIKLGAIIGGGTGGGALGSSLGIAAVGGTTGVEGIVNDMLGNTGAGAGGVGATCSVTVAGVSKSTC